MTRFLFSILAFAAALAAHAFSVNEAKKVRSYSNVDGERQTVSCTNMAEPYSRREAFKILSAAAVGGSLLVALPIESHASGGATAGKYT